MLEPVPPDPATSRALLDQARLHLAGGHRVSAGAGGHIVIIGEAKRRLAALEPALARIDRMRRTRHQLFYDLEEVSEPQLEGALADAGAVLQAVEGNLG